MIKVGSRIWGETAFKKQDVKTGSFLIRVSQGLSYAHPPWCILTGRYKKLKQI